MAGELQFSGLLSQTGLTVTASVYDKAGTEVASEISCPEIDSLALYIGDMSASVVTRGRYLVRFFSGSEMLGQGYLDWDGQQEILPISASDVWSLTAEGDLSFDAALRVILAAVAGAGGPDESGNFSYRDVADTKDRITASVSDSGVRTSVVLDGD